MSFYPEWLGILSWAYLSVSFACAATIIGDELRRPQKTMLWIELADFVRQ